MNHNNTPLHIVGIGGTLRKSSTSLSALKAALSAAETAGAVTTLLDLHILNLPMYDPELDYTDYGAHVHQYISTVRQADALLISTAAYHGSLAGVTKNAIDLLDFLPKRNGESYLHNIPVGLIATAGGDQAAVNTIGTLVQIVHSLRGTVLPLSVPIHNAKSAIAPDGRITDGKTAVRLEKLGELLVETAARFQSKPTRIG
ncbi:MAG: NAD(P)H-dependent oxidoreductase [Anaerolineaceae bacterium]|nr:NAD(P)H-dependent oxidoreductase [Anaerolineaceae bacterium]